MPEIARNQVIELKTRMQDQLENSRAGERLRRGIQVAIVGQPNVGKSTLLNMLVQRPAAIVSPLPGTTRDIVETRFDLKGYPVIISDTAGIREQTSDVIEKEGITRAIEAANHADIIVLVQDATAEPKAAKLDLAHFGLKDTGQVKLKVINKVDLNDQVLDETSLKISSKSGQGMDEFLSRLLEIVRDLCHTQSGGQDCPGLTRERHRLHLAKAVKFLEDYLEDEAKETADLVICAHHLRKAVREIGMVSGKVSSDQILDVIFADFCIGK